LYIYNKIILAFTFTIYRSCYTPTLLRILSSHMSAYMIFNQAYHRDSNLNQHRA